MIITMQLLLTRSTAVPGIPCRWGKAIFQFVELLGIGG